MSIVEECLHQSDNEEVLAMAIRYKEGILGKLKEKGYTTYRLKKESIFGERTIQEFRAQGEIPYKTLNKLCELLGCEIGDVIEYIPDVEEEPTRVVVVGVPQMETQVELTIKKAGE